MVALPTAIAFTTPFASTVATAVLELLHETFLFVALAGETLAVKLEELPTTIDALVGVRLIPVTLIGKTVIALVAL